MQKKLNDEKQKCKKHTKGGVDVMRKLLKRLFLGVLVLPLISTGSWAKTQQEQIDELKRMIEQNQKENQELRQKLEQIEAERATEKMKVEEFITKEEKKDEELSTLYNIFKRIDLGFSVDTTYQYVFNHPENEPIQLRSLYTEDNQFAINAFTITLAKTPVMDESFWDLIGFRADILFGEQADNLASTGFGDDVVAPYQLYLHVLAPVGNGIGIQAGRFVTLAGYEVIEAKNNPNITRSILFGFAIPFTHTGIRTSYSAGPLTFYAGLNNGWDVTEETNDAKTIEGQIALALPDIAPSVTNISLAVTGYFGEETSDDPALLYDDWRNLITVVGSVTLFDILKLVADVDFGWQRGITSVDLGLDDDQAFWWGVAGYAIVDLHPAVGFAVRAEYFDDQEGFRTGLEQKLFEITPTLAIKPFKGLISGNRYLDNFEFRAEFRWDHSNEEFFVDDNGGLKENQYGITGQLLYWIDL